MVLGYGVCNSLQQHRLARSRRGYNQSALAFSQWCYHVDYSGRKVFLSDLHLQHLVWIQRSKIVEEDLLAGLIGRLEIDRLNLDQGEIALAFFRRTNLSADRIAGAQIKFPYLRGRHINVVRARKIVVFGCAQETEP